MAQVTMTGKEYEDLLLIRQRYEELMFLLIGGRFPKVSNDPEAEGWKIQDGVGIGSLYPKWLVEKIAPVVVNYVSTFSQEQFNNLVKEDRHYYDAVDGSFCSYECNSATVDLMKDLGFKARWNNAKKEMETDEQQQTDN